MARWAPEKKHVFEALAAEIRHNYGAGRVVVAIDGRRDAGTAAFADALAEVLSADGVQVFRASMDDFQEPRERRERGRFEWGYDVSLLRRVLIDPFRVAGSTGFVLAGFDAERDVPIFQPQWASAGPDAMLIVDGVFLHRPEMAGLWNTSVWLETAAASGDAADGHYIAEFNPSALATAIYDGHDPEHPRRIFADSC